MIFVGQAQADLGREATIGSFAILASAVCYALNIILMRQQAQVAGPVEIAFFQSLIVTVVLAAFIPLAGIAVEDRDVGLGNIDRGGADDFPARLSPPRRSGAGVAGRDCPGRQESGAGRGEDRPGSGDGRSGVE